MPLYAIRVKLDGIAPSLEPHRGALLRLGVSRDQAGDTMFKLHFSGESQVWTTDDLPRAVTTSEGRGNVYEAGCPGFDILVRGWEEFLEVVTLEVATEE